MNHREVMQQAPEALEAMTTARCGGDDGMDISPINDAYDKAEAATTSLRAALVEQPEPPPEAQTEAEQRAYTFGWFKALHQAEQQVVIYTDGPWQEVDDICKAATTSLRAALVEQPEPPPEAQTEAEQRAYTFGWFKALEKSREMQEALQIIATPQRPDGTWNRDREACRQLAAEALGFHNKGGRDE